jgi:hypothetical protein
LSGGLFEDVLLQYPMGHQEKECAPPTEEEQSREETGQSLTKRVAQ